VDAGIGTMEDVNDNDIFRKLSMHFYSMNSEISLRQRADFLLSRSLVSRGELQRLIKLENIGITHYPTEGPLGATAVRVSFKKSKKNQYGKFENAGTFRHKDIGLCSVSAIGFYLFSRFMINGEEWPNMEKRQYW
jgi:hypothetical protein